MSPLIPSSITEAKTWLAPQTSSRR